jgi:hypothetical protein
MSSFDKFIKDLEKRQAAKAKRRKTLVDNQQPTAKDRVFLYAEKWQNSIRYSRKVKK